MIGYIFRECSGSVPALFTPDSVLHMSTSRSLTTLVRGVSLPVLLGAAALAGNPVRSNCDPDNGGLVVPEGSCAVLVADDVGAVRQLAVGPNGDLYAAIADGGRGGILVLRDRNGDGKPDERASFGPVGVNDVQLHGDYIYASWSDAVRRYQLSPDRLEPAGPAETIVTGLPAQSGHRAKSLAFGPNNVMYVSVGSATNSCQQNDRARRSPGKDPCTELERRAGIWAFSADKVNQRFEDGRRFATGLRNALALTTQPRNETLYAVVHGRDQLSDNWGFSAQVNANNPGEELVQVQEGDDFGWPYCYYSNDHHRKVLAPEYGGDGDKVGRCESAKDPLLSFPGHWAPLALAFYNADQFGPKYKGGLFIAFHGSWNRAPLPQAGYRVVFVPSVNGRPSGEYSTFATARSGPTDLRASGVAVSPDGSLYISADANGKIWKISKKK
jgi:glucose/arabinose dehydrogenase